MITATAVELSTRVPRTRSLYSDAASLASSSMLTAVLGIGFWAACARFIPPDTLGVQTALLSIITAPAIVIASGVGDAFCAILPARPVRRAGLVAQGYRIVVVSAAVLGLLAAAVAVLVLPQVRGSVSVAI